VARISSQLHGLLTDRSRSVDRAEVDR
jgi:hypothetical protein